MEFGRIGAQVPTGHIPEIRDAEREQILSAFWNVRIHGSRDHQRMERGNAIIESAESRQHSPATR